MNSSEDEQRLLHSVNGPMFEIVPEEPDKSLTEESDNCLTEGSDNRLTKRPGEYTFEEAVENFGFGRFQVRLILSAGMVVLSDAVQLLAPAVFGNVLECESWQLSKVAVAWLTTAAFIGKMIFSPIIGWIIDRVGRRRGILFSLLFSPIFAALGSFSPSYTFLLVSRFLVGAASAGTLQLCGYIEEFLPVRHRRRAMLIQLFWPFGGLWTSGFGLLMIYQYDLSWKWYLLVQSAPAFLMVLTFSLLPESARFLGALGKFDKVDKILTKIGSENRTGPPEGNLYRASLYSSADGEAEMPKSTFRDLFSGGNLITTILLSIIWFAAGFSYYGIVLLVPILNTKKDANIQTCNPLTLSDYGGLMWTGFAELPGMIIIYYALEYFGRKKSLIFQFIIAGYSLVPFFFDLPTAANFTAILIGRATCQSIVSALSIYTPEVYPTFLRGKGTGLTNMFFRAGAMITPFFSQVTVEHYFTLTIAIYVGCFLIGAICSMALPKETRGIALEH